MPCPRKTCTLISISLIAAGIAVLTVRGIMMSDLISTFSPRLPPAGLSLHPERKAFSAAVFSDFAGRINSVEEIGKSISRKNVAFTLCLGDLVRKRTHWDFFHVSKEIGEHLNTPIYTVPGNWDRNDSDRWETYRTHFGQDYYFFSYGNTLFIALNTAEGTLPEEQQEFLKQTLKRERAHFARCVMFCHIPPKDPRKEGHHAMDPVYSEIFRNIIQPYKIDLILCGHIHCYAKSDFGGSPLVTAPSAGQEVQDTENRLFGYLLLEFPENGPIRVRRIGVTPNTGFEDMEYFFTVELCSLGWMIGALAATIAGLLLFFGIHAGKCRFRG